MSPKPPENKSSLAEKLEHLKTERASKTMSEGEREGKKLERRTKSLEKIRLTLIDVLNQVNEGYLDGEATLSHETTKIAAALVVILQWSKRNDAFGNEIYIAVDLSRDELSNMTDPTFKVRLVVRGKEVKLLNTENEGWREKLETKIYKMAWLNSGDKNEATEN